MDLHYLRNTLKMIITGKTKNGASFDINQHFKVYPVTPKESFTLKGDMAQEFNETMQGDIDDVSPEEISFYDN